MMHVFTAAFRARDLALFVFRKGEDDFGVRMFVLQPLCQLFLASSCHDARISERA